MAIQKKPIVMAKGWIDRRPKLAGGSGIESMSLTLK